MDKALVEKYERMKRDIASCGRIAVAFSGGVDSSFLLYAAREALPGDVLAVTARSVSFPEQEMTEAADFCTENGIPQTVVNVDQMKVEGFADNPPERCYLCKKAIFNEIIRAAADAGITAVAEGSNKDDDADYRPGRKAIEELGVKSPLRDAGFTKAEIRKMSGILGLPTASKPSYACLATRFPYGERITEKKLLMAGSAEQLLFDLGFAQRRVRVHGDMARIELLPGDFDRFMKEEIRLRVYRELKELGFSYISLDLLGYRTGSMNETL